jgi:hypothetical protein
VWVRKLHLTVLLTTVVVTSSFTTASARNLSFSNQNISSSWSRLEVDKVSSTVRCELSLEGSLTSRTITKVARTLIGAITRATFPACTDGTRSARALPWHLTYESFSGTLPRISRINLLLSRSLIHEEIFGMINCDYGTSADNITFSGSVGSFGEISGLTPVSGRNVVHLLEGPILGCTQERRIISSEGGGGPMGTAITLI